MAQFGRALRSGRRGRVFESRRFDFQQKHRKRKVSGAFFLPKNKDLSIEKPHLSQYKYSNKQCKYRNSTAENHKLPCKLFICSRLLGHDIA